MTVDIGKEERPFYLDAHMLEHFSFDHIEGKHAFVRIGLGAGSGANRYDFTQLGLKLPIPAPLQASFQQADRAGMLGRSLNKIPVEKNMTVTFREAPARP
jgi:hypothetical protein